MNTYEIGDTVIALVNNTEYKVVILAIKDTTGSNSPAFPHTMIYANMGTYQDIELTPMNVLITPEEIVRKVTTGIPKYGIAYIIKQAANSEHNWKDFTHSLWIALVRNKRLNNALGRELRVYKYQNMAHVYWSIRNMLFYGIAIYDHEGNYEPSFYNDFRRG